MSTIVTVAGNLTKDFEVVHFNSGGMIAKSSVAVNNRKRNDAGEWVDGDPEFFELIVDEKAGAENCVNSLAKGVRIVVTGRLKIRDYETTDGTKGRAVEIRVDEIGPALRWASVEGVTRSTGGGSKGKSEEYLDD